MITAYDANIILKSHGIL